eukprot:scaffold108407_cov51-Phaeocystis_antarctica.AAC.1
MGACLNSDAIDRHVAPGVDLHPLPGSVSPGRPRRWRVQLRLGKASAARDVVVNRRVGPVALGRLEPGRLVYDELKAAVALSLRSDESGGAGGGGVGGGEGGEGGEGGGLGDGGGGE